MTVKSFTGIDSKCPSLLAATAAYTDHGQYLDLVLSYNASSGAYFVSSTRKAFRLYLNMSFSNLITGNKTATFVSSMECALSLFFQVQLWTIFNIIVNPHPILLIFMYQQHACLHLTRLLQHVCTTLCHLHQHIVSY